MSHDNKEIKFQG